MQLADGGRLVYGYCMERGPSSGFKNCAHLLGEESSHKENAVVSSSNVVKEVHLQRYVSYYANFWC